MESNLVSTLARDLKAGDQIVQPETEELLTIESAARSHRPDDQFDQWTTLRFVDGRTVEVHDGDLLDRVTP